MGRRYTDFLAVFVLVYRFVIILTHFETIGFKGTADAKKLCPGLSACIGVPRKLTLKQRKKFRTKDSNTPVWRGCIPDPQALEVAGGHPPGQVLP